MAALEVEESMHDGVETRLNTNSSEALLFEILAAISENEFPEAGNSIASRRVWRCRPAIGSARSAGGAQAQ